MSIIVSRQQRRELARENARQPIKLAPVPFHLWPGASPGAQIPVHVWRSRDFLVQQYNAPAPAFGRLSVCRTSMTGDRWQDGITWDDLQRLKQECGLGDAWAVELFPADNQIVNVANMRHIWLLHGAPPFAWTKP